MIKNGIPFDVAHNLIDAGEEGDIEVLAYTVVFGEMRGGEFDWSQLKWKENK